MLASLPNNVNGCSKKYVNLSAWGGGKCPKKALFRAKNLALCRYHSCAAAPRRHLQASGEETADGEVNRARTKRRLFPRRCLSAATMSHSSAPRWALINSNFTF